MSSELEKLIALQELDLKLRRLRTLLVKVIDERKQLEAAIDSHASMLTEIERGLQNSSKNYPFKEENGFTTYQDRMGAASEISRLETEIQLYIGKSSHLTKQAQEIDEQFKALDGKREIIISSLSAFLVRVYDRIKSRDGIALAEIRNNCCQYCNILVRYPLLKRIRKGEQITTCENCGRILYCKPVAMTQSVTRVN